MRLAKALSDKLMDKRLRDKLLAEGKVTKAQVDEFLEGLSDDESNVTQADTTKAEAAPSEELQ